MNERQTGVKRAAVLSAAVDILTASGDLRAARQAAEELAQVATQYYAPAFRAAAAHATGAVLLSEGDTQGALENLREAWTLWQELEVPHESARTRVLLGLACQQLGDPAAAELEFDAARGLFQRLAAEPDLTRVDALRQRSHRTDTHTLTPRELQVINLVAQGKTNRAIAELLSISERTVDRHVSNILLKLDVPSRSAATAYAWKHGLIAPTG
jgi:DNA-binding CsgD family transcriptional regulator